MQSENSRKNIDSSIVVGGKLLSFSEPKVMGIVNVTSDSFYSGSRTPDVESLRQRVAQIRREGADFIDIGGYSSRPGAGDVSPDEEYSRLARALEIVKVLWPEAIVSVDTFRSDVARRCVEEWGVSIINDIGGGSLDADMWDAVASLDVAYILMHTRGTPATMDNLTQYDDVSAEVLSDLAYKCATLYDKGVKDVIVDPGFGFAKRIEQNYRLISYLNEFRQLGPVLVGVSRKRMVYTPIEVSAEEAGNGTTVVNTIALLNGADILRVHDVRAAVEAVKLTSLYKESK